MGIVKNMGGNIPGGNFLGGNFPGGSLLGWNFPGGNFQVGVFLIPRKINLVNIRKRNFLDFISYKFVSSVLSKNCKKSK